MQLSFCMFLLNRLDLFSLSAVSQTSVNVKINTIICLFVQETVQAIFHSRCLRKCLQTRSGKMWRRLFAKEITEISFDFWNELVLTDKTVKLVFSKQWTQCAVLNIVIINYNEFVTHAFLCSTSIFYRMYCYVCMCVIHFNLNNAFFLDNKHEPSNCKWITHVPSEQSKKSSNSVHTYGWLQ